MRRLSLAVLFFSPCLSGCGGELDDRPASFAYLHAAIIAPNCTSVGCHSKFTASGGLRLETLEDAYFGLVIGNIVVPGRPVASRLLYLLRGEEVPRRMPPDQALPNADIDLIERWILEGAQRN